MINILLCGCGGRMGKTITELSKSHTDLSISAGVDRLDFATSYPIFKDIMEVNIKCDVILDFSNPALLSSLLKYSKEKNIPLVLCATGYSEEQLKEIKEASSYCTIFRSANMSVGINLLKRVLSMVTSVLYDGFDIEIIEKHHNQKLDSPSGTAILLGDTIKKAIAEETSFIYGREGISKRKHNEIGIHAVRGGSIVGDHEVIFAGQGETLEFKHSATSRDVFAAGALKACQFISGKTSGMYSMDDVIEENISNIIS